MAIRVAEVKNHPDLAQIKETYYQWLNGSGQEDVLGQIKEMDGDFAGAVSIYLKGGIPGKAAQVILKNGTENKDLVSSVAKALVRNNLYEKVKRILII